MIALRTWRGDFESYVEEVRSGSIVVGKLEKAAVDRYLKDVKTANRRGYKFDWHRVNDVCNFFRDLLTLSDGEYAGKPFDLKPWQVFVLGNLFGWIHRRTGYRRYRDAFVSMARGNGKSPFLAGILFYLLGFDYPEPEARAEVYSCGTKRDQARIVFDECKRFVSNEESLQTYVRPHLLRLMVPDNESVMAPLGSDAKNADGLNIHGLGRDELHAWQERHRELYEKLDTALGKRRQSLAVTITTAGTEQSDIWMEQYSFARAVVEPGNKIDCDQLFVFICQIDEEDDPFDEAVWPKANPMLEHGIVKRGYLQAEANKAKLNPSAHLQFIRYFCNRLVTSREKPFTSEIWARGDQPLPDYGEIPVYLGFDWGEKNDLSALALVCPFGPDRQGKMQYALEAWCWCPEESRYRNLNREPWASWIEKGWLIPTPGDSTDPEAIHQKLEELVEKHSIGCVAFDGHNCQMFESKLQNHFGLKTHRFRQSCKTFHEPLREFETAVAEGRLLHAGNGLLGWCALNMTVKSDAAGYRMPDKPRCQDKIDPIVAAVQALSQAMLLEEQHPWFYLENEVEYCD